MVVLKTIASETCHFLCAAANTGDANYGRTPAVETHVQAEAANRSWSFNLWHAFTPMTVLGVWFNIPSLSGPWCRCERFRCADDTLLCRCQHGRPRSACVGLLTFAV